MILSRHSSDPGRPPERLRDQWCCEVAINPVDLRDRFEGILPRDAVAETRLPILADGPFAAVEHPRSFLQEPSARVTPKEGEVRAAAPPRLLLVEDENDLRHLYACELEDEGYRVLEAWNERSALVYLELGVVDLVILDVNLSGASGPGLLKQILARRPRPPVVICTAYDCCRYFEGALQADAFVVKSQDLGELKQQVRKLLDGSVCH